MLARQATHTSDEPIHAPEPDAGSADFLRSLAPSTRVSVLADMDDEHVQALPEDLREEARRLQQNRRVQLARRLQESRWDHTAQLFGRPRLRHALDSAMLHAEAGADGHGRSSSRLVPLPTAAVSGIAASQQKKYVEVLSRHHLASLLVVLLHPSLPLETSNIIQVCHSAMFADGIASWLLSALMSFIHRALGYDGESSSEEPMQVTEASAQSSLTTTQATSMESQLVQQVAKTSSTTPAELGWLSAPCSSLAHSAAVPLFSVRGKDLIFNKSLVPHVLKRVLSALLTLVNVFPSFLIMPLDYSKVACDQHGFSKVKRCDGQKMTAPYYSDIWLLLKMLDDSYLAWLSQSFDHEETKDLPALSLGPVSQSDISSSFLGRLLALLDSPCIESSQDLTEMVLKVADNICQRCIRLKTSASSAKKTSDIDFGQSVDRGLSLSLDGRFINHKSHPLCVEVQEKLGLPSQHAQAAQTFIVSQLCQAGACRVARADIFALLTRHFMKKSLTDKSMSYCQEILESVSRLDRAHTFQALHCGLQVAEKVAMSLNHDLDELHASLCKEASDSGSLAATSGSADYVDESLSAALRSQAVTTVSSSVAPPSSQQMQNSHVKVAQLLSEIGPKQAAFVCLLEILRSLHHFINRQVHDMILEFTLSSPKPADTSAGSKSFHVWCFFYSAHTHVVDILVFCLAVRLLCDKLHRIRSTKQWKRELTALHSRDFLVLKLCLFIICWSGTAIHSMSWFGFLRIFLSWQGWNIYKTFSGFVIGRASVPLSMVNSASA